MSVHWTLQNQWLKLNESVHGRFCLNWHHFCVGRHLSSIMMVYCKMQLNCWPTSSEPGLFRVSWLWAIIDFKIVAQQELERFCKLNTGNPRQCKWHSSRRNSSKRVITLDPLCLWQCFEVHSTSKFCKFITNMCKRTQIRFSVTADVGFS